MKFIKDHAPISSLPSEILAAIFETGHTSQSPEDRFEITISHVSQHWRDIAIGMPRLWTGIRGKPLEPEAIAAYLQRSLKLPFDFRLESAVVDETAGYQETISTMFGLLRPHIGRCRQLAIDSLTQPTMSDIFDSLRDISAPILESLFISCNRCRYYRNGQYSLSPRVEIFTGGAPSLTSIRFANVGLHQYLPPLQSLTVLRLIAHPFPGVSTAFGQWHHIILSSASLLHLAIDDEVIRDWRSVSPLELPLLQTLSLKAN